MDSEGKTASIFEAGDALIKSWWTVVAALSFGAVATLLILAYVDKRYEAATLIRVAPQSIPEDFVRSTVTDDMSERLLEIEQAILGRAYMDQLIAVAFGAPTSEAERESMRRRLRGRISVINPGDTRLASLVYSDTDAQRAADVVNLLTQLYVEQNKEFRATQAEGTRRTFEDRAELAQAELDVIEQQLSEFNTLHRHETEAFLDANLQLLETRRDDLEANQRDQGATRLRLDGLHSRLEFGGEITTADGVVVRDPNAARMRQLRRDLDDLKTRYAETHPDVVKKKREIRDAEAAPYVDEAGSAGLTGPQVDPEVAALNTQIQAVELELEHLQENERELRGEIALIERRINRTPEIQAQLSDLQEQARILEERYRDDKSKAERARTSELLEETEQGQRLEVLEWAVVPYAPTYPDPMLIGLMSIGGAFALFVGPVILRAVLNPLVSSEAGLRNLTEIPILVSIPRLLTQDTSGIARKRFLKNLGFSVLSSAALAAVFVMLNGL